MFITSVDQSISSDLSLLQSVGNDMLCFSSNRNFVKSNTLASYYVPYEVSTTLYLNIKPTSRLVLVQVTYSH